MSTATAFQELAATASVICQEIDLCNRLAHALSSEQWDSEQLQLVANTHATSIAQILHCQRALLLEVIEVEMAPQNAPRRYAGGFTPGA